MKFRNDIQEIRGVAILLVFFYHLCSNYVPGGYIGVDVFFVISGFLVSNMIYSNSNENGFANIFIFYGKRIKRLFPSSLVCLVCCYLYHPSLPKYSLYETQLYYDILSALLCYSNIRFYKTSLSYFQNEKKSILINYWSLSLEEQYYLLLPLIFTFIKNDFLLSILWLFSFIYCVSATYNDDNSCYYILYSRAWELLLGGFAKTNIILNSNSKSLVIMIIISSYLIGLNSTLKFPGFIAIVPTFLTFLLLLENKSHIFKSNILEIIGSMSYVFYLFHYPIIQNNKSYYVILLKVSTVSFSVYYFIEKPIKKSKEIKDFVIISLILSIIFIKRIWISIAKNNIYYSKQINNSYCKNKIGCSISLLQNINDYSILLIGDSHLDQFLSIILTSLEKNNVGKILFLQTWIINLHFNYRSILYLIANFKKLLLCIISLYVDYSFSYVEKSGFENNFRFIIREILNVGSSIIIFQDNPHRFSMNSTRCRQHQFPIIENSKIKYIDIFGEFCKGNDSCIGNIYSRRIFKDFHHLQKIFVCKSNLIHNLINNAISSFLINYKSNSTLCSVLDIRYKNEYNKLIINNYSIKTLKRTAKINKFGLAEKPEFYYI